MQEKFYYKKKFQRYLLSSLLCVLIIFCIPYFLNTNIFANENNNSNVGVINLEIKLYDYNNQEIFVNSGDIAIYDLSSLCIDEYSKKPIINENCKEIEYYLYGNKIVLPINIYTEKVLLKNSSNTNNNISYNIKINDLSNYSVAMTSPINTVNLNDFKENITLLECLNSSITNIEQRIDDSKLEIVLDNIVVKINNTKLKNSILNFSFKQKQEESKVFLRFKQLTNVTYSNKSEEIVSLLSNTEENNTNKLEALTGTLKNINQFPYTLLDYSATGNFSMPVTEFLSKDINYKENNNIYYVNNGTIIRSITDNGTVEKINENILKIKYTDSFFVLYENIIPSVFNNDIVNVGNIIGIVEPNKTVKITYYLNNSPVLCEWMFDRFPEANIGASMTLFLQKDPEWKLSQYGSSTIGRGGCGPTSFAMILSYFRGEAFSPEELVLYMKEMGNGSFSWCHAKGKGSYHSIFPKLSEEFGLQCEEIKISKNSFIEELNKGKFIVLCINSGPIYKGDGHFIVLRGVTEDGSFLINDSAGLFDLNSKYEYKDLGHISAAKTIFN